MVVFFILPIHYKVDYNIKHYHTNKVRIDILLPLVVERTSFMFSTNIPFSFIYSGKYLWTILYSICNGNWRWHRASKYATLSTLLVDPIFILLYDDIYQSVVAMLLHHILFVYHILHISFFPLYLTDNLPFLCLQLIIQFLQFFRTLFKRSTQTVIGS